MIKPTAILTRKQLSFINFFSRSPFTRHFYLTGGTALCGFYIPYRYSDDLDFFSPKEFDLQSIIVWLRSNKNKLKFEKFDIQKSFNRNLIFLFFPKNILKTEFTYFPFPQKQKTNKFKNLIIDSLEDIAINKLFTIYQRPRLRDFTDLYMIVITKKLSLKKIIADAKIKFDWHIDPIQLGSQFLSVEEHQDKPRLVREFDYKAMYLFYREQAKALKEQIIR